MVIAKLSIADVYIKPKEVEGFLYFYLCEQTQGLFTVYFSVCQIFTVHQIWSTPLSARSGLSDLIYSTACLPDLPLVYISDLIYFTVCQIWSTSLSARSALSAMYHISCQVCSDKEVLEAVSLREAQCWQPL